MATLGFPHLTDTTEDEVKKLLPDRVTMAPPPVVAEAVVMLVSWRHRKATREQITSEKTRVRNFQNNSAYGLSACMQWSNQQHTAGLWYEKNVSELVSEVVRPLARSVTGKLPPVDAGVKNVI
jgi:hypothetical protein